MMRSLFTGVSGLRVHQTKMDVIANNISNVNTVGFKSSRVTFNEVFYQRIQGASGANEETGRAGTNPIAIGLGVSVATIDNLMTQGTPQRTDNPFDIMIQGAGFFIVSDNSGMYFTRAGNFILDHNYNLSMNGLKLMGWEVDPLDPTKITSGAVRPITIDGEKQYVSPVPTSKIDIVGNLNAHEDKVVNRTMEFYDSVGNRYTVDIRMTYGPELDPPLDNTTEYSFWQFEFIDTDSDGNVFAYPENIRRNPDGSHAGVPLSIELGASLTSTSVASPPVNSGILVFNHTGKLVGTVKDEAAANAIAAPSDINPVLVNMLVQINDHPNLPNPTAWFGAEVYNATNERVPEIGAIQLNFTGLTGFVGEATNAKSLYRNGNGPGTLMDMNIGPDGKITGRYSNGMTKLLGQIPVARFVNPAGLEKIGNNLFVVTPNSGPFDGVGETGNLMGGVLEMANVDLSAEFTEMITTQRGFQANSRIITVSDDMLQELVNLKR
ncbi:MAG: flagellar hook protein FlgE [Defluviitaleaceae bacterium]|nr:flagellar hook protein FlgE [Defluviitaleaceae bacterium]